MHKRDASWLKVKQAQDCAHTWQQPDKHEIASLVWVSDDSQVEEINCSTLQIDKVCRTHEELGYWLASLT
jgi:hypothetical protein